MPVRVRAVTGAGTVSTPPAKRSVERAVAVGARTRGGVERAVAMTVLLGSVVMTVLPGSVVMTVLPGTVEMTAPRGPDLRPAVGGTGRGAHGPLTLHEAPRASFRRRLGFPSPGSPTR